MPVTDDYSSIQKNTETIMRGYGEQKAVVGSSLHKPVKSFDKSFVGMSMSFSRTKGKWFFERYLNWSLFVNSYV